MRRQALLSVAVTVLLTSAIASAGIYGVVAVMQSETALLDDADQPSSDAADPTDVIRLPDDEGVDRLDIGVDDFDILPPGSVVPPPLNARRRTVPEPVPVRFYRVSAGRLVPAERADVFIVQNGQPILRERLGQGGVVQVSDVPDGIYSLIARGTDGYAVVRTALVEGGPIANIGLVPWVDMPAIDPIIEADVFGGRTQATLGDPVPPGNWSSLLFGNDFTIGPDGLVHGRVSRLPELGGEVYPIVNTKVAFVRNGQVIAETVTDNRGEYALPGLSPGVHALVVASNLGLVVISVEILEFSDSEVVDTQGTDLQFVSFVDDRDPPAVDPAAPPSVEPVPPGDLLPGGAGGLGGLGGPGMGFCGPQFGGGAGGGGFGGGGGGFGGGGGGVGGGGFLGPLLAGALGAGLGFLAGDDDGDDPVSP